MTSTTMELADAYGNQRMTDGHHDLTEDHPHTLKARAALDQRIKELERDAARWKAVKELAGYWQDSSDETVKLFQDDATRTYHVVCGRRSYFGNNFNEAIDRAMSEGKP